MAQTTIENGQSGLSVRTALNTMFGELYASPGATQFLPNILDFDAGGTPGTGNDDTANMQAAANAGGGSVLYPPAVYNFDKITVPSGGIIGGGTSLVNTGTAIGATVLKSYNTGSDDLITFTGNETNSNYPVFKDFGLILDSGQKSTGAGIAIIPTSGSSQPGHFAVFDNLVLRYVPTGFKIRESSEFLAFRCHLQYYAVRGIDFSRDGNPDAGDSGIEQCSFFNPGYSGTAIYQTNAGGLRWVANKINGGAKGYHLDLKNVTSITNITGGSVENVVGEAFLFENTVNTGIAPVRYAHVQFAGPEFSGNGQDIVFKEIANYSGVSYWDNFNIAGTTHYPYNVISGKAAIEVNSARNFNILATMDGNGSAGDGIQIKASADGGFINSKTIKGMTNAVVNSGTNVNVFDGTATGVKNEVNVQTGTSYTLLTTDNNKMITLSNSGAITLTMPNSLPVGFACSVVQGGTGAITFTPASGATRTNSSSHTKSGGQYAACALAVVANSGGAAAVYNLSGSTAA